jgi:hypothetical protein
MNFRSGSLRLTDGRLPRRIVAVGLMASLVLAVSMCLAAGASAGTLAKSGPHENSKGLTAAEDQYGQQHVVPPAKQNVEAATAGNTSPPPTTPSAPLTPPSSTATTTPAQTPTTTSSAPLTPPSSTATASPAQTLPFTGMALLKVVLVGLGLVGLGVLLRRWPSGSSRDQ